MEGPAVQVTSWGSCGVARGDSAAMVLLAFQSPPPPGAGGHSPIISSILTSLLWTVIVFRSFYSPFNKTDITTSPPCCQNEDKKGGGGFLTPELSSARRAGVWWPTHSGTPGPSKSTGWLRGCRGHLRGPTVRGGAPGLLCDPSHQSPRCFWPCGPPRNVDQTGSVCPLALRAGKGERESPTSHPSLSLRATPRAPRDPDFPAEVASSARGLSGCFLCWEDCSDLCTPYSLSSNRTLLMSPSQGPLPDHCAWKSTPFTPPLLLLSRAHLLVLSHVARWLYGWSLLFRTTVPQAGVLAGFVHSSIPISPNNKYVLKE
ncbi:uncharacterized protein LOC113939119 [Zalophus californianus]|uniref:Uncharacterized protein LOC113939119 n=1 Tax=Zalophus californianus TaxID=9704 RepID=A0A6J2FKM0_ZALCA|nr:uncharacterized protein LOC113939119 [Zalophus californianus]